MKILFGLNRKVMTGCHLGEDEVSCGEDSASILRTMRTRISTRTLSVQNIRIITFHSLESNSGDLINSRLKKVSY